jgi:hypothetical protein
MTNNDIVHKLWNFYDVLRDDGINYGDYKCGADGFDNVLGLTTWTAIICNLRQANMIYVSR